MIYLTPAKTHPISLIADWCAKLYEDTDFRGSVLTIPITDKYNLPRSFNDKASSLKVKDGCSLYLFGDYNLGNPLGDFWGDEEFLRGNNDVVSSLACECSEIASKFWYFMCILQICKLLHIAYLFQ